MMTAKEILEEIEQGKNLDIHIQSSDKTIRRMIAEHGYMLDKLVEDRSDEVRAAVARKGYGLTKLANDKSDWVRLAVSDILNKRSRFNAGYEIIGNMSIEGKSFSLGYNPNGSAVYVTWAYNPSDGTYCYGHYFNSKTAALIDLTKRAAAEMNLENTSIGRALLTEQDLDAIHAEFRQKDIEEDIAAALENLINYNEFPKDIMSLVKNEVFMKIAMQVYSNMDHAEENELLEQKLIEIIKNFPEHDQSRPEGNQISLSNQQIELSPEENQLYKDLLTMSSCEITKKYGPMGDDVEIPFPLGSNLTGYIMLHQDESNATNPYVVALEVRQGREVLGNRIFPHKTDLTGEYTSMISGMSINVTVKENESLGRTGNEFIFKAISEDERYKSYNGETCKVLRALSPKEADILLTGLMWEVQFSNGDQIHVFDEELVAPQQERRKPSLTNQIEQAESKTGGKLPADPELRQR